MISHEHKCIFIHIPKCAGSSVEKAFNIDNSNNEANYNSLFGWCDENKFLMQHATPQQLLDSGLLTVNQWKTYYKFIIYRNSWSKSLSDYIYLFETSKILGKFSDYSKAYGVYYNKLHSDNSHKPIYEGSHLLKQKDFFYLDGDLIEYDSAFSLNDISLGFEKVARDLKLHPDFFNVHINKSTIRVKHYSLLYNSKRKKIIEKLYKDDIDFFDFTFEDKKNALSTIISNFNLSFLIKNRKLLKLIK